MDHIGVFDVATSGADEQRIASRKQADKLAAAIYDVKEKHGEWLFGAKDLDGFDDRAKLAHVSICQAIEPHMHARTGVYSRVIRALKKEWRERQADLSEGTIGERIDTSVSNAAAGPKGPKTPKMPTEHVKGPQLEGRRTACYPGCHEDEAHAKKFHKEDKEARRRQAGPHDEGYAEGTQDAGRGRFNLQNHPRSSEPEFAEGYYKGHDAWAYPHEARRHYADDGAYDEHAPDHPELHTDITYEEHTYEPLKPEGDFDAYKDSVDQGAESKVDHDFVHGGGEVRKHDESGDHNFVPTVTGRRRQADMPAVPSSTGPIAQPTGGTSYAPEGFESPNPGATPAGAGQMSLPGMELPGSVKAGRYYPEYERIARMLYATGDPTSMPAGAPGAGAPGAAPADPGMGVSPAMTAPAPPTSATAAGSGTPVQPMTASREYQIIARMIQGADVAPGQPMGGPLAGIGDAGTPTTQGGPGGMGLADTMAQSQTGTGVFGPEGHTGRRHLADRNYLQQADEAITKVLNEKAEEFQNTIAPLQQALITIQQAEQLANPLNVSPPAGTVNVLPQGADPNQAPQGQGGLGADPAAAGLAAQPQQQMQARRRKRGGHPKGEARLAGHPTDNRPHGHRGLESWPSERHDNWMEENPDSYPEESPFYSGPEYSSHGRPEEWDKQGRTADVTEDYGKWLNKKPGAPTGGPVDYEQFAQEKHVGPRALQKLKYQPSETPAATGVTARRKKRALIAEPDRVWSKSPSTVNLEFANRMAAGSHPDDVYRQLIAEITDHHQRGEINNHDAHRAANEAFGRLLFSRRRRPRQATKKQSWMGWGPDNATPKRHKVAGWGWDQHLNGYISNSPRQFECSCGVPVKVPDYHRCKCGRVWNTYVIGTGGDRHEASAEKFIAREVPERGEMLVANRKKRKSAYDDYHKRLNDWENEQETENAFPSDHHPKTPQGKSFPDDWHRRDHKTQQWTK